MSCLCSEWEEIEEFSSPGEYDKFVNWIEGHIASGKVKEVPVEKRYGGFKERWFRCPTCGTIWRLVDHDFPFKGLFARVEGARLSGN